jgi:hypothetical protein
LFTIVFPKYSRLPVPHKEEGHEREEKAHEDTLEYGG